MSSQLKDDLIRNALQENEDAIHFIDLIGSITQAWDDLHDGDKELTPALVDRAFEQAMLMLPTNRFYLQHFESLHMVVCMGINAWKDSNTLIERGSRNDLVMAYTLRDLIGEVLLASACIVGGYHWMRKVSLQLRLDVINDESFEDFCKGLGHEYR